MGFASLRFSQFRNAIDQTVSLRTPSGAAREVFLTGRNGQGKTNFLEAVYLLAYGSSFRTKIDRRLCRHGTHEFSIGAESDDPACPPIQLKLQDGKKHILLGEKPVADRKDLVRNLPCIAFTHEDYLFVSGGPEYQRQYFDQTLSLFDVLYIDALRQYRKLLRAKNALLTSTGDPRVMDVYDLQLVRAGLELRQARLQAVELINPAFSALFEQITGLSGACTLRYSPSWKDADEGAIVEALGSRREADRHLGFTATGPHRDRFSFVHAGRNFAEHASTGQIRLMSLLLRIVQARLTYERSGRPPVLLLDDVLLELDGVRRQRVLDCLPAFDQAFFTFLPEERGQPSFRQNPLYLEVEAGQYRPYGAPDGR